MQTENLFRLWVDEKYTRAEICMNKGKKKPKQNNKIYSPVELGSEVAEHEPC